MNDGDGGDDTLGGWGRFGPTLPGGRAGRVGDTERNGAATDEPQTRPGVPRAIGASEEARRGGDPDDLPGPRAPRPANSDGAATDRPPPSQSAHIGELIANRYFIEQLIGRGGMGEVYRANQIALRRTVAIKLITAAQADRAGARARFAREARVASSLRHPSAVAVYDYGEHQGRLYLVMEYVRGVTLSRRLAQAGGVMPLPQALRLAGQLADVLVAAHALSLVHRDIKPGNVMVEALSDGAERARLMDFGLSFIGGDETGLGRFTQEGLVTGTPEYMAPEQAVGDPVGPPADMYAFGCVLFEMLTGDLPYTAPATGLMLAKHMYQPVPRINACNPALHAPPELQDLVLALLEKRAADRPTAEQARDALQTLDPDRPLRTGTAPGEVLLGREARMVSEPPALATPTSTADEVEAGPTLLGVAGPAGDEFLLGLRSQGFAPQVLSEPADGLGLPLLLLLDATPAVAARWVGLGPSVVVVPAATLDVEPAAFLRVGVDEVVTPAAGVDRVVRQLLRARRKRNRP